MRIGFIGLGTIATAVVEGIADDGHEISVSARSRINSARLAERFGHVTVAENQQVVDGSDVVILGTTGDAAQAALAPLRFRKGQRIISLMADVSFAATAALVAPAEMAARMIPFPAIAAGNSPILVSGDRSLVDELFGARNSVFALGSEEELGSFLCAQAVLAPAVSMVKDAADWLKRRGLSDPDTAELFLRSLVGSSLLGSPCAELLEALDTPGGYNQRLRQHMRDAGLGRELREGLDRLLG
ncbi:pyrroline-5-carboxylate reductase [Hoeflea marina]|uniref:Pyrroline-5-carboxylate reductase n=1 Tax=Hoeflea marina TaxID=274592 RepID=A0A317PMJ6_9HYPH|nr:NAD(P)-binding domain-containing protein [Hoeflea marina]PWW01489.1 pyrroline-5-carboxylate reductase [Hoeflea marina]